MIYHYNQIKKNIEYKSIQSVFVQFAIYLFNVSSIKHILIKVITMYCIYLNRMFIFGFLWFYTACPFPSAFLQFKDYVPVLRRLFLLRILSLMSLLTAHYPDQFIDCPDHTDHCRPHSYICLQILASFLMFLPILTAVLFCGPLGREELDSTALAISVKYYSYLLMSSVSSVSVFLYMNLFCLSRYPQSYLNCLFRDQSQSRSDFL